MFGLSQNIQEMYSYLKMFTNLSQLEGINQIDLGLIIYYDIFVNILKSGKWTMKKLYAELINEKIEEKRQEMIRLAIDFGFTSQLAVQASQELDTLLNAAATRDKQLHTSFSIRYLKKFKKAIAKK